MERSISLMNNSESGRQQLHPFIARLFIDFISNINSRLWQARL